MKIGIIGAGNTATVLGKKFRQAGHHIVQVMSRTEAHAAALAVDLNCGYTSSWADLDPLADVYILAIPDALLSSLPVDAEFHDKLLLHTAGSVEMEVLQGRSGRYGVLYPLQSLRKEIPVPQQIPILISGNNEESLAQIVSLTTSISDRVHVIDNFRRLRLHLAAVMVNNFTNHLYTLSNEYCKAENIDFNLLIPLAKETANRLEYLSPALLQTGPAARGDYSTLKTHLELLTAQPELARLYELLSDSILKHRRV